MKMTMKTRSLAFAYSLLDGNAVYLYKCFSAEKNMVGVFFPAVFIKPQSHVRVCPIDRHSDMPDEALIAWYSDIILHPVRTDYFDWPIDFVFIPDENGEGGYTALVFREWNDSGFYPLKEYLTQNYINTVHDHRNPRTLAMCRNLVAAISLLNERGYLLGEYSVQHILYHPKDMSIRFLYTGSIRHANRNPADEAAMIRPLFPGTASPEFLSLKLETQTGEPRYLSPEDDAEALTALLFKLMTGRLPYEGSGMVEYGYVMTAEYEMNETAYQLYFDAYHKLKTFIFDDSDQSNALDEMSANILPRERWETLPEQARKLFIAVFSSSRSKNIHNTVSAKAWKDLLLSWNQ